MAKRNLHHLFFTDADQDPETSVGEDAEIVASVALEEGEIRFLDMTPSASEPSIAVVVVEAVSLEPRALDPEVRPWMAAASAFEPRPARDSPQPVERPSRQSRQDTQS